MLQRFIILMTLLTLLPLSAQAAPKKKGKAPAKAVATAAVIAVIGKPEFSVDGGKTFKKIKIGMTLPVGGILRTGNGKLTLFLSEGSSVHMGEQSEMTLKQHNPSEAKGGSIFDMAKGLARFVVNKLQPGRSFEVSSPNAVAAVKGTDFLMELHQGGETIVKVFKTDTLSAVALSGLDREKSVLIKENSQGGFDGKSFTQDKFEEKSQQEFKNKFEGLPVVPPQEGAPQGGGEAGGEQGAGGEGEGEGEGEGAAEGEGEQADTDENFENEIDEIVAGVLEDFYNEIADDAAAESALRANDIAEGRVVYDRQGYQTQVFHRISRPDPYTIQNEAMSRREFGPNAGDTVAVEWTGWNLPLPDDWASVAGRALDHPDNLEYLTVASGYPIYFRTWGDFWASNPVGDSFEVFTTFHAPSVCVMCPSAPNLIQQGYRQDFYLNGYHGPGDSWYIDYATQEGSTTSYSGLQLGCPYCGDSDVQMTASPDASNGGWKFSYTDVLNGSTPIFSQSLTLIDDNGNIFDTSGFGGVTSPNDFRGVDLHVEMTLSSDYFSQDIDLIFLQGFFDTFEIIQVPAGYYGGCNYC